MTKIRLARFTFVLKVAKRDPLAYRSLCALCFGALSIGYFSITDRAPLNSAKRDVSSDAAEVLAAQA
jgi:hypothetical protein